ncbi:MAG: hypothetical protein WCP63_07420 [Cyanobium sp. ELA712]
MKWVLCTGQDSCFGMKIVFIRITPSLGAYSQMNAKNPEKTGKFDAHGFGTSCVETSS